MTSSLIASAMLRDPLYHIECLTAPSYTKYLISSIAADPKRLGARIGVTAVLHTWGSALTHHPHVHMIVPGGGFSLDKARWVASRSNFLVCQCRLNFPHLCRSKIPQVRRSA